MINKTYFACLISTGTEFQSPGALTIKAWVPLAFLLDFGTVRSIRGSAENKRFDIKLEEKPYIVKLILWVPFKFSSLTLRETKNHYLLHPKSSIRYIGGPCCPLKVEESHEPQM